MSNNHDKLTRRNMLKMSAAGVGALALAGCSSPAEEPAAAEENVEEASQEKQNYIWLCAVTSVAFWIDGREGMEAAAEELGVTTEFLGPVEYDAAQQLKTLEELIATEPDGIMIFPADTESLNDAMKRAMDNDIPILCVNSDVSDPSARYGFVGPDNYQVGRQGGQIVAELLGGSGQVAIMTVPGIEVHESRSGGYEDELANYPDIEIVDIVNDESDPEVGLNVATQLIQAHPDLDLIIGTDATAGAAIARALKETGKDGEIKVVAMDRDQDMLPYVKDGTIDATLAQNSELEEWTALHYLYWLRNNSVPAFEEAGWKAAGAPQVPRYTDTGVSVVTQDNVDFYIREE